MKSTFFPRIKNILSDLRDHRFSRILLKYFLILFLCLALPIMVADIWYCNNLRKETQTHLLQGNASSMAEAAVNMDAVIHSMENLAYSLSQDSSVQYLSTIRNMSENRTNNFQNLQKMLNITKRANVYLDSVCVWFEISDTFVTGEGSTVGEYYQDRECLDQYFEAKAKRIQLCQRKKNGVYPYLLTILYPFGKPEEKNTGAVVINIDLERLGKYFGSGRYHSRELSSNLMLFSVDTQELMFSDEYRFYRDDAEWIDELREEIRWDEDISEIRTIWGNRFMLSSITSSYGFKYVYLSSVEEMDLQNEKLNKTMYNMIAISAGICLILAFLLAKWVYRPIKKTVELLDSASMMTAWDRKTNLNEIESIQKSILEAKKERESLNEQIQERMISLHNSQICALQAQINPHFLFNSLDSIGNKAVMLWNGENEVTDAVFALGKLLQVSLSGENYLVPISEELEHIRLYMKMMDFRFKNRIELIEEIPEEMKKERIVKLTLQPLIENAISHGMAGKRNDCKIWIYGKKEEEKYHIYVIDNGVGMETAKIEELKKALEESSIGKSVHIGLRNVHTRLRLVFGDDYGLDISRAGTGGLCVTLSFKHL